MESITNLLDGHTDLSLQQLGIIPLSSVLRALLTLMICLIAMRIAVSLAKKALAHSHGEPQIKKYTLIGLRILMWAVTALIVADQLGIPVTSLVALLSIFTLAISLAIQTILSNVAGGLVLLSNKPFRVGDYIATDSGEGTVQEINLTYTKLDTMDGLSLVIPNSTLSASKVTNYTSLHAGRRLDVSVGASYDAAIDEVRQAGLEAMAHLPGLMDPAPVVYVEQYGDSSIQYLLRCWVESSRYWDAKFALTEGIKRAFDAHQIEMTYNHLNVHIVDSDS